MMKILIVAADENGCIGKENKLPWSFREDMQWFKEQTMHYAVIMGRNTFESIGKPLKHRYNIVVSRSGQSPLFDQYPEVKVVRDVYDSLLAAGRQTYQTVFFCGGAALYKFVLDERLVDKILLTRVKGYYDGDTFFPYWPLTDHGWVASGQEKYSKTPELSFWSYVRPT